MTRAKALALKWTLPSVFVLFGLITWWVKASLWYLSNGIYYSALYGLAIGGAVLGAAIIWKAEHRWFVAVLIAIGLAIGQLWLLQRWFTYLTWSLSGFAP
jgi:hypothetical protein